MNKVLIVDDLEENRYILEKLLEARCLQVISASNGKEALEKAFASPPDLVISDILMPVMDGYSLCKVWKSDDRLKQIPFLFYTATYTDPKDELFALSLGADRFIIKPQEPMVLIEMIGEFIRDERSIVPGEPKPLGSEMEFFRKYNEVLFHKLEQKVWELEQTNRLLQEEIDEHKKTEERLLKLTQALEENPVAIMITSLEGDVEYVNPKFLQLSGYADREVIGRNIRFLQAKENRPDIYREIWKTVRNNEIWNGELCSRRKDGEIFWAHLTMSPLKDVDGRVSQYLAIMEDTSLRRKLEEQLRQAQKLEGIGQLAGGVAHDFNNILTAIIGYAHLAYLNMEDNDPQRGHLRHILDYSDKAATITKSLLTFSRKQTTQPSYFNFNDLVFNFQKFLRRLLPENIEIETVRTPKVLPVLVDQVQIEQVIMNLATNARDAMPDGGHFTVTTDLVEIDKSFLDVHGFGKIGEYAELRVTDTGYGMDERTREKIFDPFFTTKEQGKGTGLGMAIVYGIIQQHNGYIHLASNPGKGTQFRILLPVVRPVVAKDRKIDKSMFPGGSETILVAEDEPGIRDLITTILSEKGYAVIAAADGEEALRYFQENREKVALTILDGIMPKKSGKDVRREILRIKPGAKVILLSGYPENMIDMDEVKDVGVHFLQKPVMPSKILKKVREVLDSGN